MAEGTRIDKYLWAIRVFKTRTDATDACKGGKVRLNGNDVKPSRTVACGDIINVRKGAVLYSYKVVAKLHRRSLTSSGILWRHFSSRGIPEPADRQRRTAARWNCFGIHLISMFPMMLRTALPTNSTSTTERSRTAIRDSSNHRNNGCRPCT